MRPHARAVVTVALAGALAVALGACSSDPTLDQSATQRAVGRSVAAKVEPSVTATRCPEEIEQAKGVTFACTVTLAGVGAMPVEVRQVDDDGKLDVAPTAAIVTVDRISEELTAALAKRFGRTFTVRCSGDPTEIRAPRSTSTCSARDGSSAREVTVTVTDAAGTLAFAVAPPK